MIKPKRFIMVFLALVIMLGGLGLSARPAQAGTCAQYHTVQPGQTLSWIGRYYGVSWTYLAEINNIAKPSLVYVGQVLCISYGGGSVPPYPGPFTPVGWNYAIVDVEQDKTVTIRTSNFPSNVLFKVSIGRLKDGAYEWTEVATPIDSGKGGTFKQIIDIPAGYVGVKNLVLRLEQVKKKDGSIVRKVDHPFSNIPNWAGTGGPGWGPGGCYGPIPTIWIKSVVKDSTITIYTRNFPANVTFDVLMGKMGTKGIHGYNVGTLDSGAGGSLEATFTIPAELQGASRIAIRTQNLSTGYYSYNWFYNNTAN